MNVVETKFRFWHWKVLDACHGRLGFYMVCSVLKEQLKTLGIDHFPIRVCLHAVDVEKPFRNGIAHHFGAIRICHGKTDDRFCLFVVRGKSVRKENLFSRASSPDLEINTSTLPFVTLCERNSTVTIIILLYSMFFILICWILPLLSGLFGKIFPNDRFDRLIFFRMIQYQVDVFIHAALFRSEEVPGTAKL